MDLGTLSEFQVTILISFTTIFATLLGALFVLTQVRLHRKQLKFETLLKISDVNRQLVMLGFDYPALFDALAQDGEDSELKSRYFQLWINQCDLIHHAVNLRLLNKEHEHALAQDISQFFSRNDVLRHWSLVEDYYPHGLRRYISSILALRR